ncbi:hypothetical protein PENTCL1PPCAC_18055, partial [Pristionchus entomophagus]
SPPLDMPFLPTTIRHPFSLLPSPIILFLLVLLWVDIPIPANHLVVGVNSSLHLVLSALPSCTNPVKIPAIQDVIPAPPPPPAALHPLHAVLPLVVNPPPALLLVLPPVVHLQGNTHITSPVPLLLVVIRVAEGENDRRGILPFVQERRGDSAEENNQWNNQSNTCHSFEFESLVMCLSLPIFSLDRTNRSTRTNLIFIPSDLSFLISSQSFHSSQFEIFHLELNI